MREEFLALEQKTKKLEKKFGSLENFVLSTTKPVLPHRMRIEVDDALRAVYLDLQDLEMADLTDFQKEGYGEFS